MNKKDKSGFTLMEVVIVFVVTAIISLFLLGAYKTFFNNGSNITSVIASKIKLEEQISKNNTVDGFKFLSGESTLPYIQIEDKKITYTAKTGTGVSCISSDGSPSESCLFKEDFNYTKNDDGDIIVTIDGVSNGIVYFNKYGLPVDKSGNSVDFSITIRKKFVDNSISKGQTISVSKLGEIKIINN